MRIWFLVCCYAMAVDHYAFTGDFSHINVYQHENMLLIKDISNLVLIEQSDITIQSYLSDFSKSDAILEVKSNSYCIVKKKDILTIDCYDQLDESGKMHILIDAGHGGKDSGAISANGLKEKHVTLSYVKKLLQYLNHDWIKVDLTRQRDVYVDKYDRLRMVLKLQPDIMLSVHADAYAQSSVSGVGIFYLNDSTGSSLSQKLIAGFTSKNDMRLASKKFANNILERLKGEYKLHATAPQSLPLVILRSPMGISILLELGFLSNPKEANYLGSENYLEGFAEDMAEILLSVWKQKEYIISVAFFN